MRIPTNHNRLKKLRLRERKQRGSLSEQKANRANGRKPARQGVPSARHLSLLPGGLVARSQQQAAGHLVVRGRAALETVQEALGALVARYRSEEVLTAVKHIPARDAQFRPMPAWVRPELASAYRAKGVETLYSHQAAAAGFAREGKNVVVVTPTASGKTLCYNLPVLSALPLPHQSARSRPARRTARPRHALGRLLRRLHL
jgi:superfamily II RNA helicase